MCVRGCGEGLCACVGGVCGVGMSVRAECGRG